MAQRRGRMLARAPTASLSSAAVNATPHVRDATGADVDALADLHLANFDADELSSILGRRFVRAFYSQAIADGDVVVRVVESGGRLVALSVVFHRYRAFESRFRARGRVAFARFAVAALVRGRVREIVRALRAAASRRLLDHVDPRIADAYLGAIVLDAAYRKDAAVITAFFRVLRDNAAALRARSPDGFWASARASNVPSARALQMVRMEEAAVVPAYPEAIRIFRYTAPRAVPAGGANR
jgi:hypothetical protein